MMIPVWHVFLVLWLVTRKQSKKELAFLQKFEDGLCFIGCIFFECLKKFGLYAVIAYWISSVLFEFPFFSFLDYIF